MENSLKAMYYIALDCDVKEHNTEEENIQWKKVNQNRLNQNFSAIYDVIESLERRIYELEK